jgi:CheY-like chemotaxis protein
MNGAHFDSVRQRAKVLVVDDSESYSLILRRVLQKSLGLKDVTVINNLSDAQRALESAPQRFNILLIDYHFPSGDTGADLVKSLNRKGLLEGKVAFIITSDPTIDHTEKALNAGATGVIGKPIDSEKLQEQLLLARRFLEVETLG